MAKKSTKSTPAPTPPPEPKVEETPAATTDAVEENLPGLITPQMACSWICSKSD